MNSVPELSERDPANPPPDVATAHAAAEHRVGFIGWYTLVILTSVYVLSQIDRKVISIVTEPIKHEFGLSDGQVGALTGLMYGAPNAIMLLPMGLLIDRVSRRNLCAAMIGVWSAACAATGLATGYIQLMIARAAVGAAESAGTSSGLSMIADIFPKRLRPAATALFQAGVPLGTILCFTVIAWVAAQYGWRGAFIAAGVPGVVVSALLFLTVREPQRGAADEEQQIAGELPRRATLLDGLRFVLFNRVALHYVIGPALVSSASSGVILWLPSFLMRSHGMSIAAAGYLIAMTSGVITALALAASGPAASRFARGDDRRLALVPIFSVTVSIAFAIVFLLVQSMPLMIAALCLFTAFNYLYLSLGYTLLLGVTPAWMRGTVLSIELIAANLLGYAGGPLIVGLLSDAIGGPQALRWALISILVLYAWGVLHLWLGRRAIVAGVKAQDG
jgi:MFS family permease